MFELVGASLQSSSMSSSAASATVVALAASAGAFAELDLRSLCLARSTFSGDSLGAVLCRISFDPDFGLQAVICEFVGGGAGPISRALGIEVEELALDDCSADAGASAVSSPPASSTW